MRAWLGPLGIVSAVLAGCHGQAPASASAGRTPRSASPLPGLWEQTLTRDGVTPALIGRTRLCLVATKAKGMAPLARELTPRACVRTANRETIAGLEVFGLHCELGDGGASEASGRVTRSSPTTYDLHEVSVTRGAAMPGLNGRHVVDIHARWLGPCPAGMAPGEVALSGGMKVNLARAAAAAALVSAGR